MAIPEGPSERAAFFQALARERAYRAKTVEHELEVRSVQMGTLLDLLRAHEERRVIEHDEHAAEMKKLREDLARCRELIAQALPAGVQHGYALWCKMRDEIEGTGG